MAGQFQKIPHFKPTWRHHSLVNWLVVYAILVVYSQFVWFLAALEEPDRVISQIAWPAAMLIALALSLIAYWIRRRGTPWLVMALVLAFKCILVIASLRSIMRLTDPVDLVLTVGQVIAMGLVPVFILLPFIRRYSHSKSDIRDQAIADRKAIEPGLRAELSAQACRRLFDLLTSQVSPDLGYIAVYSAIASELSLEVLALMLGEAGYRVAYPAILGPGQMEFYSTIGSDSLDLSSVGIIADPMSVREPKALERLEPVADHELAVVIVPGVAFDRECHRMGYGGGFYDRYLPRVAGQAAAFGICFDQQLVEALLVERHDQRLDAVVTPTVCYYGSPSWLEGLRLRLRKKEQG